MNANTKLEAESDKNNRRRPSFELSKQLVEQSQYNTENPDV